MTPPQRAAALRLAEGPRTSEELWRRAVIALLRELAAEPVQEPVAWGVFVDDELFKPFNCKDEAVDWFQAQYNHGSRYDFLVLPLYAAPQQRKPLTDEQLKQAMSDAGVRVFQPGLWDVLLDAGRAIEHAHGIIGEPT